MTRSERIEFPDGRSVPIKQRRPPKPWSDNMLTRCSACGAIEVEVDGPFRIVEIGGEIYRTGYGCECCG